ncbi:L-threonylcarbamoyladenylate synthase [bacterium]|nr:MAG: L-threonylcarbamoyladenylate synthase [bacterium]QQR61603.1 MAG: L-threonylcarbamoyladenylate synthase [bacterium]
MYFLSWKSHEVNTFLYQKIVENKVFLGSTDTVLGLMSAATPQGRARLNSIKRRDDKPYIILIDSMNELELFVDRAVQDRLLPFLEQIWPGPISVIMPAKSGIASFYVGNEQKIALRMPDHAGLLRVMHRCGPLFSTSANISNSPTPDNIIDIDPVIIEQVEAVVMDDGIEKKNIPSTIIEYKDGQCVIVRAGAFDSAALLKKYAMAIQGCEK